MAKNLPKRARPDVVAAERGGDWTKRMDGEGVPGDANLEQAAAAAADGRITVVGKRHVLQATTYSKSVLRVAAEIVRWGDIVTKAGLTAISAPATA